MNIDNLTEIFESIDKSLKPTEKHFKRVAILNQFEEFSVIGKSAFSNITFGEFEAMNISFIHSNTFGKAAPTIKNFTSHGHLGSSPPDYDI